MSLTFHWFLPTSGDGRAIIGRGHSVPLVNGAVTAGNAAGHGRSPGRRTSTTWPRSPGPRSSSASPAC